MSIKAWEAISAATLWQAGLHDLAVALGMTPGEWLDVRQDARTKRWWLVGCGEGDVVLPRTQGLATAAEAVEAAGAWLAPELESP